LETKETFLELTKLTLVAAFSGAVHQQYPRHFRPHPGYSIAPRHPRSRDDSYLTATKEWEEVWGPSSVGGQNRRLVDKQDTRICKNSRLLGEVGNEVDGTSVFLFTTAKMQNHWRGGKSETKHQATMVRHHRYCGVKSLCAPAMGDFGIKVKSRVDRWTVDCGGRVRSCGACREGPKG